MQTTLRVMRSVANQSESAQAVFSEVTFVFTTVSRHLYEKLQFIVLLPVRESC
jgi:hypothetical protein